ncbi:MAG: hypothetical protein PUD76_07770 [Clostridia bacterium]|nr:hypothetical protein [Clostridia bacterium]
MFEPRYPDHKNGSGRNRCRFQILPYLWIYPKRSDLLRHFAFYGSRLQQRGTQSVKMFALPVGCAGRATLWTGHKPSASIRDDLRMVYQMPSQSDFKASACAFIVIFYAARS